MIAEARDYHQLWAVLRTRADALGISRENIDAEAGLPAGYAGTLLAPAQVKKMGLSSLGPLLGILRLKLIVAEDEQLPNVVKPSATHQAASNKTRKAPLKQRCARLPARAIQR